MKNVISYIFIIIALLLLGVNGVAAQKEECPFTVTGDMDNTNITYGKEVLSIQGLGKVTITGDGKPTGWGIVLESGGLGFSVTIINLNIERDGVPLEIKSSVSLCPIILEGTNRFVSTAASGSSGFLSRELLSISGDGTLTVEGSPGAPGIGGNYLEIRSGIIHVKGGKGAPGIGVNGPAQEGMQLYLRGGSVTAIGGEGAVAIDCGTATDRPQIGANAFVLAINGKDAESRIGDYIKGLVIQGKQLSNGTIEQTSSTLKGDITLTNDAEIPAWATVTIPDGQTVTIPDGKTLTNKGIIENNGTLANNGTLNLEGSAEITGSNPIGGTGVTIGEVEVGLWSLDGVSVGGNLPLQLYNKATNTYYKPINNTDRKFQVPLNVEYQVCVEKDYNGARVTPQVNNEILSIKDVYIVYFNIEGETDFNTFRVNDAPLLPYQPEKTCPNHTLRWYTDYQYTKEITDWSKKPSQYTLSYKIEIYGRWEPNPLPPPVVPDPEPEPAPTVYYTVTLPSVAGAVTDPVAGDYEVESWSTFRFYLTLDTAYSESAPVITTDRGETLTPRSSDGAYQVKYVRTDVSVFIDGIVKNNPVANETIRAATPEPEIWSENACLCIRLPEGMPSSPVRIFTPEGRLLDSFRSVPGLNRWQLPTGIYIVQVGETVRKVAIR